MGVDWCCWCRCCASCVGSWWFIEWGCRCVVCEMALPSLFVRTTLHAYLHSTHDLTALSLLPCSCVPLHWVVSLVHKRPCHHPLLCASDRTPTLSKVFFTPERSGKGPIAAREGVTVMVDDRLDCIDFVLQGVGPMGAWGAWLRPHMPPAATLTICSTWESVCDTVLPGRAIATVEPSACGGVGVGGGGGGGGGKGSSHAAAAP